MRAAPALALPLLLLAAGCTPSEDRYPSLLPRPIESQSLAEPVVTPAPAAPDPALDKRIAELTQGLDAAAKAFASEARSAEALVQVARGVPVGSDAWLDAQAALGAVNQKHLPVVVVLTDLDALAIERGSAGKPPYPALDAAVARVAALSREQEARIATLEAALTSE